MSPEEMRALERWLVDVPHHDDGGISFVGELVERLLAAGMPVARASLALITMHPELVWRTLQWDGTVVARDRTHAQLGEAFYRASPVARVREGAGPIRVRLDGDSLPFPICVDLRGQGFSDYYVQALPFANGQVSYVSFASRSPAGFDDGAIEAFAAIAPFLARRLELESAYFATRALLDVYLGRNAGRRVYQGAFQRGRGELVEAAIWFSDMRDFTALSDRRPPAEVIEILDAYFDAVATAISDHGGEVLKFIGDAVMAIFPVGEDPRAACLGALAAAEASLEALSKLDHPIAIGIGLHRGEVMYGNIGARDRLDFTVISAAVNETSRLESLSKTLGTSIAVSERFAETAGVDGLVDLGEHALKGVRAKVRVFTPRRSA